MCLYGVAGTTEADEMVLAEVKLGDCSLQQRAWISRRRSGKQWTRVIQLNGHSAIMRGGISSWGRRGRTHRPALPEIRLIISLHWNSVTGLIWFSCTNIFRVNFNRAYYAVCVHLSRSFRIRNGSWLVLGVLLPATVICTNL